MAFESLGLDWHIEIIMFIVDGKITGELNLERIWKERSCFKECDVLPFIGNEESIA